MKTALVLPQYQGYQVKMRTGTSHPGQQTLIQPPTFKGKKRFLQLQQ